MVTNNDRIVILTCIECGSELEFLIRNNKVVEAGGIIACNIPAAICSNCIDIQLAKLPDPPGIVAIQGLSPELAQGILECFTFMLPKLEAVNFFENLFPK